MGQDVARQTIIQVIRRWLDVIRLQVPFKSGGKLSDFVKCAAWKKCIFWSFVQDEKRKAGVGGILYSVHMSKGGEKRDCCRWQTFWLESRHTTTPWGHKGQGGYIPTHVLYTAVQNMLVKQYGETGCFLSGIARKGGLLIWVMPESMKVRWLPLDYQVLQQFNGKAFMIHTKKTRKIGTCLRWGSGWQFAPLSISISVLVTNRDDNECGKKNSLYSWHILPPYFEAFKFWH